MCDDLLGDQLHVCSVNAVFMSRLNLGDQVSNRTTTSPQVKIAVRLAGTAIELIAKKSPFRPTDWWVVTSEHQVMSLSANASLEAPLDDARMWARWIMLLLRTEARDCESCVQSKRERESMRLG